MTAFDHASRYIGAIREVPGTPDHPLIVWWLSLCGFSFDAHDEIPWCSAFVNGICWDLRLPRSKSAAARSWLTVGRPIPLIDARADADVVVLQRGPAPQPGPEVLAAPGHVGFYAGVTDARVEIVGGNQANTISVGAFPRTAILGIRRLEAP